MAAFTISLYLVDGRPDGLRKVTKSNWTGVGLMVSRREYARARSRRDEFKQSGVYLLIGPGETDPSVQRIYVGEGDNTDARISSHLAELDFWTDVIVFTKTDGLLDKADVRYLESQLISKARSARRCELANLTSPSPPTPDEAAKADLDSFLEDMLIIYKVLGVDAFEQVEEISTYPEEVLTFGRGDAVGSGVETNDGFLVKQGSTASARTNASMSRGYAALRERLIEDGVLVANGQNFVLTQDYVFGSPSAAADVLYGGSVGGPVEWKYPSGESMRDRRLRIETESGSTKESAMSES